MGSGSDYGLGQEMGSGSDGVGGLRVEFRVGAREEWTVSHPLIVCLMRQERGMGCA